MPLVAHHGVLPQVPGSSYLAEGAVLIGEVLLGEDTSIWFNAVLRGDINLIRVGHRSNVQDGAVVHVTRTLPVTIGDGVTIGHMAMIHGCAIGDGSLVGMNAVVLDGAEVGPRGLVAAGSVVREGFFVPEGMLAAGVPARIVRALTADELAQMARSAENYVQYARSFHQ